MRILHTVEFYAPSRGGAQEVVKQISERLALRGHDVTVATSRLPARTFDRLNGVKIADFAISGNMVRGLRGEAQRYVDFLLKSDFDVVMNYAAQQWTTDLCLPILDRIKAKKVLIPCGFAGLFRPQYRDYYARMPGWMKQYDASVYLSEEYRDIAFAREHGIPGLHLIPNGCGIDEFGSPPAIGIREKLAIPAKDFLILHVGTHTGVKGHRELFELIDKSGIRDATLLIAANTLRWGCRFSCPARAWRANHSAALKARGVRVVMADLSRPETLAAYHAADLFLFPSNIEASPLVLFEAMASRTPFLTTDVGNSREIIRWSQGGLLLPTRISDSGMSYARVDEGAALLSELRSSPEKLAALGEAGHAAWLRRFTWEGLVEEYEKLYADLVRSPRQPK